MHVCDYKDNARSLIHKIKFNSDGYAMYTAAELMTLEVEKSSARYDIVIPIPMHKTRKKIRGYNQAAILGKLISKKLGVKFKKIY